LQGVLFEEAVANPLVRSEKNPAIFADRRQPSLIRRPASKMAEVTLVTCSSAVQDFKKRGGATKVFVEV